MISTMRVNCNTILSEQLEKIKINAAVTIMLQTDKSHNKVIVERASINDKKIKKYLDYIVHQKYVEKEDDVFVFYFELKDKNKKPKKVDKSIDHLTFDDIVVMTYRVYGKYYLKPQFMTSFCEENLPKPNAVMKNVVVEFCKTKEYYKSLSKEQKELIQTLKLDNYAE